MHVRRPCCGLAGGPPGSGVTARAVLPMVASCTPQPQPQVQGARAWRAQRKHTDIVQPAVLLQPLTFAAGWSAGAHFAMGDPARLSLPGPVQVRHRCGSAAQQVNALRSADACRARAPLLMLLGLTPMAEGYAKHTRRVTALRGGFQGTLSAQAGRATRDGTTAIAWLHGSPEGARPSTWPLPTVTATTAKMRR